MGVHFERAHDIVIHASPAEVLDYVSNPNSWPEWMPATHHIEAPDRPLAAGEAFSEKWATRQGEVMLDWRVSERKDGRVWIAETATPFTGPIQARYTVEETAEGTRYTRTIVNPDRPKAPTEEMVRRMDDEAAVCLANIKRAVESRRRP
ncbi:MAG: SRPBCC family protein [Acidimicrobiales bacterium]